MCDTLGGRMASRQPPQDERSQEGNPDAGRQPKMHCPVADLVFPATASVGRVRTRRWPQSDAPNSGTGGSAACSLTSDGHRMPLHAPEVLCKASCCNYPVAATVQGVQDAPAAAEVKAGRVDDSCLGPLGEQPDGRYPGVALAEPTDRPQDERSQEGNPDAGRRCQQRWEGYGNEAADDYAKKGRLDNTMFELLLIADVLADAKMPKPGYAEASHNWSNAATVGKKGCLCRVPPPPKAHDAKPAGRPDPPKDPHQWRSPSGQGPWLPWLTKAQEQARDHVTVPPYYSGLPARCHCGAMATEAKARRHITDRAAQSCLAPSQVGQMATGLLRRVPRHKLKVSIIPLPGEPGQEDSDAQDVAVPPCPASAVGVDGPRDGEKHAGRPLGGQPDGR